MLKMKNYMEDVVRHTLDSIIDKEDCCNCEKCRLDIMAIVLNDLPSKYVVTREGELYAKVNNLRQQFEVDVVAAITKAAAIVKQNPRHEHYEA